MPRPMPTTSTKPTSLSTLKGIEFAFSDSDDEDNACENLLASMPMPTSIPARTSTSANSNLCSQHGHFRSHPPLPMHPPHGRQQQDHHVSQQSLQQQRKRSLNSSSAMSSASSCVGGRKAAPLSPLAGQCQSQAHKSSSIGQANEFEEDYSGVQVNQMLSKLGVDLQQKVRAKRQKLEEYFKSVKAAPGITLVSRQRHIEQRNKLVEELKTELGKCTEKLDNVGQVQNANHEKHTKMLSSLTRGAEQVRLAIAECAKAQTSLYEKFMAELKKLEDNQEDGTKELMERCESTLIDLQNKIASEQMKSETDSLFKLKFI